uniref:HDC16183 n=1 Tax=Drosophila melanogaster TaxID=7227 RepID=Q6IJ13_DROME|nr:TPA_inf: HDC16183 [Drosophila melanogaster]
MRESVAQAQQDPGFGSASATKSGHCALVVVVVVAMLMLMAIVLLVLRVVMVVVVLVILLVVAASLSWYSAQDQRQDNARVNPNG